MPRISGKGDPISMDRRRSNQFLDIARVDYYSAIGGRGIIISIRPKKMDYLREYFGLGRGSRRI